MLSGILITLVESLWFDRANPVNGPRLNVVFGFAQAWTQTRLLLPVWLGTLVFFTQVSGFQPEIDKSYCKYS